VGAQRKLVEYYGCGATKDEVEGAKWCRKLAEQGDAEAAYFLGCKYQNGQGVPENLSEAARLYRLAAE
jgi:TPR repeat protein